MTKQLHKTAIITGAAKRVGRSMALALAADGYDIALHYNHSAEEAEATANDIRALGVDCHIFAADLTNHAEVTALIPRIDSAMGNLSILINNASIFPPISFTDTTETAFDDNMNVHVKAPFFLSQAFAKCAEDGNIINISDTYVRTNVGAYFAYLLSKKALTDLTPMLAKELAPRIRVNAIALGMTEFNDNLDPDYIAKRSAELPMHGAVSADEITRTVRHLIDHPTITGETIFVDRGAHLL